MDEMILTLNSPITEEQWAALTDVDFDNTEEINFHTKHGKEVHFVKRKTGKWIHGREVCREYMGITLITVQYDHWECSVCGYRTENEPIWNFCPNCNADMRG